MVDIEQLLSSFIFSFEPFFIIKTPSNFGMFLQNMVKIKFSIWKHMQHDGIDGNHICSSKTYCIIP